MQKRWIALAGLALSALATFIWSGRREPGGHPGALDAKVRGAPARIENAPFVMEAQPAVQVRTSADEPVVQTAAEGESTEAPSAAQRAHGIHGRVLHGGAGVAGAWVRLFAPAQGARTEQIDDLPSRVHSPACSHAICAADGTFVLPLQTAGVYLVSAGAADLCWTTLGPKHFVAQEGAEEIELVLPDPGTIEGQMFFPADERPHEWIVAASQGDGIVVAVHADKRGHFRFAAATPGSWVLRPRETELPACGIATVTLGELRDDTPVRYTCQVQSGKTTQVEIDLRDPAMFSGEIRIARCEYGTVHGQLTPIDASFSRTISFEGDVLGGLQAKVDQPGDYWLLLELPCGANSVWLEERLHLVAGENAWKIGSHAGELVLVNTLDTRAGALLRCRLGGTRRASVRVVLQPHEEVRLEGLPIGIWNRVREENGNEIEEGGVEVRDSIPARLEWK